MSEEDSELVTEAQSNRVIFYDLTSNRSSIYFFKSPLPLILRGG